MDAVFTPRIDTTFPPTSFDESENGVSAPTLFLLHDEENKSISSLSSQVPEEHREALSCRQNEDLEPELKIFWLCLQKCVSKILSLSVIFWNN